MKDVRTHRKVRRLALLVLAVTPLASASLLLNPAGGSALAFSSDSDDEQVTRNIGGTFSLFGHDISNINVATNGFLGTAAHIDGSFRDHTVSELAEETGGAVIAPFYDDLQFTGQSSITDQGVAGTYYAVTYQNLFSTDDHSSGKSSTFQVILFIADATLDGFAFHAGDIAFSYGTINSVITDHSFTVGVAEDATNGTGTPASDDGVLTDFSTLPAGNQFFLYRPHVQLNLSAEGGDQLPTVYDVSIESTNAPEPAAMALVGLGLAGLGLWKRRN